MNNSKAPAEAWGQAMGFWFRLWQAQLDQSLKFWCLWAQTLPRPSAAELAAEAEAHRQSATQPVSTPRKPAMHNKRPATEKQDKSAPAAPLH